MRTLARDISGDNGGVKGSKSQGESQMGDKHLLERLLKYPETVLVQVFKMKIKCSSPNDNEEPFQP